MEQSSVRGKVWPSVIATALVLLAGFVFFAVKKNGYVHDENYHVPTSLYFAQMWQGNVPATLDYCNSLGVVFYGLHGLVGTLASLTALRAVEFFSLLLAVVLVATLPPARRTPLVAIFALLSGPWVLLAGYSVHSESIAAVLLLAMLHGFAVLEDPAALHRRFWLSVALFALVLAPFIRIYLIFVFPAAAVAVLVHYKWSAYRAWIVLFACSLPILALWFHWKNVIPPQFDAGIETATPEAFRTGLGGGAQKVAFQLGYLARIPITAAHIGLYALPWIWYLRKSLLKAWKFSAALFGVCLVAAMLVPLGAAGIWDSIFGKVFGLVPQVPFVSAAEQLPLLRSFYAVGLWAFCMLLVEVVRQRVGLRPVVVFILAGFTFYMLSLPLTGGLYVERYVNPMHVLAVALGLYLTQDVKRVLWPWLPYLFLGFLHTFAKPVR